MQIKTFIACACGALSLSLSLSAAPAPEDAPVFTLKENGAVLLSEIVIQKVIARDYEVRKKLADPRYYKDVQGNFKELLRELYADPFDGRAVATDKSLPEAEQAELWDIWKAYEAYMRRCEMRSVIGSLLSAYEVNSMFQYAARVERAQDFYKSDRMKRLLHDMQLFNADFHQMNTSVFKRYEEGYRFGHLYQSDVTVSDLFDAETLFGRFILADGTPNSGFSNSLSVLMRYNARMCDAELRLMRTSSTLVGKKISAAIDARQKAIASASFYKNGWPALAGIVELDERIVDCVLLACLELEKSIKTFENRDTDEFKLRTGLPMFRVFAATGAETDRAEGPNYRLLLRMAYVHLYNKFNDACEKRNGSRMPIK